MYYNRTIMLLNIFIAIIVVLIAILSSIGIIKDFALLPVCIIGTSLQMILLAYNSYKLDRSKVEIAILSIMGIFILVSTITRIII